MPTTSQERIQDSPAADQDEDDEEIYGDENVSENVASMIVLQPTSLDVTATNSNSSSPRRPSPLSLPPDAFSPDLSVVQTSSHDGQRTPPAQSQSADDFVFAGPPMLDLQDVDMHTEQPVRSSKRQRLT